jgi:hypothetical protein
MDGVIARVRSQWQPVMQAVISAAESSGGDTTEFEPFLQEMEQQAEWQMLAAAFRRIIAGERDVDELRASVDPLGAIIVADILGALGYGTPPPPAALTSQQEHDDDDQMVSLEEFLDRVVSACKPDAPLALVEQLQVATHAMAAQANLQPELRELGRVLHQMLLGERDLDVSGLPPQLAEVVRGMVEEIAN